MPVMSAMSRISLVECGGGDVSGAVVAIMYGDPPGLTADLAVLDVAPASSPLPGSTLTVFVSPQYGHTTSAARVRRAVAEREVAVEVELVVVVASPLRS